MYSDPNIELDSTPPRSQFRRPWSPEAFQSGPGSGGWSNVHMNSQSDQGPHPSQGISSGRIVQQRREASDVSVEALDLADYARTLRVRQAEDPYPPFPTQVAHPRAHYPPSAFPYLPQLATSKDSIAMHPPSLISQVPTLSSLGTHHTSSSSAPSHARRAARRPYSLPATPNNSSQGSSSRSRPGHKHRQSRQGPGQVPHIVDPDVHDEIDISNFPKWSRGWYNTNSSGNHPSRFAAELDDIYTPIPQSHFNNSTKKKSPFDPGYVHDSYNPYDSPPPLSHESSRDLLPWSMDPPEYGPPLDPMLREERMRMLEREFGSKGAKGKSRDSGLVLDDNGQPVVGTVDKKGNLVTSGPKRRILFRVLEVVLAAGACVPAIYAAIAIKPLYPKDPPPPANKPPVFALYILSSLTLILLFYLFFIRPCCIVRKPKSSANPLLVANKGMMVVPVTGPSGKKSWKGGKKGKGKYGAPGGSVGPGDVQVNLIVDPKAFRPPGTDELDDDDDDVDDDDDDENGDSMDEGSGMMPGGYGYDERRERARWKKKRRNRRRRGVMEGMRMEEDWKVARSWAKKMTAIDVGQMVLWGAAFVFIMIGQRCPSGDYQGWCDAYNLSTACACLLAVAFAVSLFFDVQDLYASKRSPRTRG